MNNELNFCDILKGHEEEIFYSPTFGKLKLDRIFDTSLQFKAMYGESILISSEGIFVGTLGSEKELCIFPSKDQRNWNKWIESQNKTWSSFCKNSHLDSIELTYKANSISVKFDDNTNNPIIKSSIALLKIHQLIESGYGGNYNKDKYNTGNYDHCDGYTIYFSFEDNVFILENCTTICPIMFHTYKQAEEFLSYPENIQLLKDYYMI